MLAIVSHTRICSGRVLPNKIFSKMSYVVSTSYGRIQGNVSKTKENFPYFSFYKIPYAKPPVGDLRFALPQPLDPWTGTKNCSKKLISTSLQVLVMKPSSNFLVGSEDCLHLNVFSPKLPDPNGGSGNLLPVLVYIHGGAFCVGSSDPRLYGPELLIDKNVVYVSINYRLGPLGFFSLGNDIAPGNQGMHDQVLALKWIQNNILQFGGDPQNVTIMGESAGAMSCFLHLVSPLSEGLFHKIIALSGSATTPFMRCDRHPSVYGKAFAKYFGSSDDASDEDIVRHLRKLPAKKLVRQTSLFRDWDHVNPMPWKPIVDDFSSNPFLPLPFEDAVRSASYLNKNIPILAGFTTEEGLIFTAPFHRSKKRWSLLFEDWEKWAPLLLFNRETDLISEKDIMAVREVKEKMFGKESAAYTDGKPANDDTNLKILTDMFSTVMFQAPLINDLELLVNHGFTVYTYAFNYSGTMTLVDVFRLTPFQLMISFTGRFLGAKFYQKELGACHGDDLFYIFPFNLTGFPQTIKTEEDQRVSSLMTQSFVKMARDGNPNVEGLHSKPWKKFEKSLKDFFVFGSKDEFEKTQSEIQDRKDFWNSVVSKFEIIDVKNSKKAIVEFHESSPYNR